MDMMTEQEFDNLWHRAESAPHATHLMEEYPSWRRRQRRVIGVAASLVAVVAVALPMMTNMKHSTNEDSYSTAYCNRAEMADQYWVEMADALLMDA